VFATWLVYAHHVEKRDSAFDRVLETARAIRLELDSDMQSIVSALQVLALSQSLQRDDLDGFRRDLSAFLSQYPDAPNISLADASGQQILNTRAPAGQPLPPRANREALDQVFRTGRPAFSKLYAGSISGELIITVNVPVYRSGEVIYDLSLNAPLVTFQAMIERQRPTADWTIAIFDHAGTNFARMPNPEQTVGRSASPTLLAELFKYPEAKLVSTSLEGIELLTAYSRSPLSGWLVATGIPTATITAPLWRTMASTVLIGGLLLIVGLAFAVRMATRIAHAEALHGVLVNELNHRVKNTLSIVQSLAAQTLRKSADLPEARRKLESRLVALGRAHNVLSDEKWHSAQLREIVEGVFEPYAARDAERFVAAGPDLRLAPRAALLISMVLHELATNALKYGALVQPDGKVLVDWSAVGDRRLRLRWREIDGPPVQPPQNKGFGSTLIEDVFARQLGGSAQLEFAPTGLVCTLECPLH
jgi:two-component sensor histidine kinase